MKDDKRYMLKSEAYTLAFMAFVLGWLIGTP